MSIEEKLIAVAENVPKVYEAGKSSMVDESKIVEKSVSGTGVVMIDDVSEVPHDVVCKVESVNLLSSNNSSGTVSGVTFAKNSDGSWTINGTASAACTHIIRWNCPFIVGTAYSFSCLYEDESGNEISAPSGLKLQIEIKNPEGGYLGWKTAPSTFTLDVSTTGAVYVNVAEGVTIDNVTIKPMLNRGDTALPYTPYVDVSGMEVARCGKNLIPYPYPLFKDTVTTNGITATLQDDGGILLNGTSTGYAYINLAKKYLGTVGVGNWINDNGLISNSTGVAGVTVRYDPNGYVIFIMVVGGTTCNNFVVYPQIEKGTKPTEFELGVNHKTYTANADGTVDGIKSLCPVMTLISNVDGVKLTVDYHKSWGKQAEYDAFWDAFQLNGTRTAYDYAFYSAGELAADGGWTDEIFKPKYDIKPKGTCYSMFFRTNIKDLTKIGCGVDIDFSQATTFNAIFYASGVVTIGVLDLRNVTAVSQAFQYCNYLKTIEKIILKDDGSQSISDTTFQWASELEEIRFEGAIGSNINFQWQSKLSGASITSIVNALSPTASGKTATFKQIAVMSNIGSPYEQEWLDLVATKPNWTISLV